MTAQVGVCLGCGQPSLRPFLDLGVMPLANALVRPECADAAEPTFPLATAFCSVCHLVQLTQVVPPEQLFATYLYFSSYSDEFLRHAREMASVLTERLMLGSASRVLEIASNDGYLLQYFQERGIHVLGIEPARNVAAAAEKRGIPTLTRFFGPGVTQEIQGRFGRADLVIGNNVMAHVPAINGFLTAVRDCLRPGGAAVFEFPYLADLLDNCEFDTIYHEHVFYLSLTAVRALAARARLEVFDVSRHGIHGGSLRVYLRPQAPQPISWSVGELLAEEAKEGLTSFERFTGFSRRVHDLKEELRSFLGTLKARGMRLAAYGAPAKGNTLLNYCGIGRDLLDFTVDRSPHKQGLLTPGSRLPILAPEALLESMPDYTLILPWNIADEIVAQQSEYLRRGGRFVIPVPKPYEVGPAGISSAVS